MPAEQPLADIRRGLTRTQAAARIGVSVWKFERLAQSEPELRGYVIPGIDSPRAKLRRWAIEDVDAFIDRLRKAAS